MTTRDLTRLAVQLQAALREQERLAVTDQILDPHGYRGR